MKRHFLFGCFLLASTTSLLLAQQPANSDQQVLAAIKEIQAQQALMADNQAKIEAKMATIAEAVRVARIYSSRAGR